MRMTVAFDTGEGERERAISPQAVVGWELATKQKMSDFANGMGVGDLVEMLYEQMKIDGDAPATKKELLASLVDIAPKNPAPTSPDAEASPDSSAS